MSSMICRVHGVCNNTAQTDVYLEPHCLLYTYLVCTYSRITHYHSGEIVQVSDLISILRINHEYNVCVVYTLYVQPDTRLVAGI